jgi:hypothetical protein
MMKSILALNALALALVASCLTAQSTGRVVELGVDAGVSFGLDSPHTTQVNLPTQAFRFGVFLGDNAELEPRVGLNSTTSDGVTVTAYNFELGVLLAPVSNPVGTGLYVRPFGGVVGASVGGDICFADCSANSGYAGAGVGIKIPFARRLATRLEANYAHFFGDASANEIGLMVGLSFFTR